MRVATVSLDLLKRIGRVLDDVCTFEECNCPGRVGKCEGYCLYSQANACQDELVKVLAEKRNQ